LASENIEHGHEDVDMNLDGSDNEDVGIIDDREKKKTDSYEKP